MNELARLPEGALVVPDGTNAADYRVSEETLALLERSDAANTKLAYAKDWKAYDAWCEAQGRTALPATPQTLADYVTHLIGLGRAPSTINRVMGTIRRAHRDKGYEGRPDTRAAKAVLKPYQRERAQQGLRAKQATPAVVDTIRAMVDTYDADTLAGIRNRAIVVLGFAIMARRSELCALDLADLREVSEGLEVTIRTSKTDQEGAGATVAVPYGSFPETCPVRTVRAWREALAERGIVEGPLFRRIDRHGRLGGTEGAAGRGGDRMSGQTVRDVIRTAAQRAGLPNADGYTAHSLRAGGATSAAANNAPASSIATQGRWSPKSPVLLGYIRAVDKWKNNPMRGIGL